MKTLKRNILLISIAWTLAGVNARASGQSCQGQNFCVNPQMPVVAQEDAQFGEERIQIACKDNLEASYGVIQQLPWSSWWVLNDGQSYAGGGYTRTAAGFDRCQYVRGLLDTVNLDSHLNVPSDPGWCGGAASSMLLKSYISDYENAFSPSSWLASGDVNYFTYETMLAVGTNLTRGGTQDAGVLNGLGSLTGHAYNVSIPSQSQFQSGMPAGIYIHVHSSDNIDHANVINGTNDGYWVVYDPWGNIYNASISGNVITWDNVKENGIGSDCAFVCGQNEDADTVTIAYAVELTNSAGGTLQAPGTPSNFKIDSQSEFSTIPVSWTSGGGSVNGYRLAVAQQATAPGCAGNYIDVPRYNAVSYNITQTSDSPPKLLEGGLVYSMSLCAVNVDQTLSGEVDIVNFTNIGDPTPPTPSNFAAKTIDSSEFVMEWSVPPQGSSTNSYIFNIAEGGTAPKCSGGTLIVGGSTTEFIVSQDAGGNALKAGTEYTMVLCGRNPNGALSAAAAYTGSTNGTAGPGKPGSFSVTSYQSQTGCYEAYVSWKAGTGDVGYTWGILPGNSQTGPSPAPCNLGGTNYSCSGGTCTAYSSGCLLHHTKFTVQVCALDSSGNYSIPVYTQNYQPPQ